jgi:hypothetical protein
MMVLSPAKHLRCAWLMAPPVHAAQRMQHREPHLEQQLGYHESAK